MNSSPPAFYLRYRVALLCMSALLPVTGCVASDAAKTSASATCDLRVIVRFQSSVDPSSRDVLSQIGSRIHAVLTYEHSIGGDQHVIQLSSHSDCERAISALQHDEQVVNAEADSMKRATH
jgi:hypothetical protein